MQQQYLNNQIEQLLKHRTAEGEAGALPEEQPLEEEPEEIIDVYFVTREPEITVVEATPPQNTQKVSQLSTYAILFFCLCFPIASILFQLSLVLNPPIATVTIFPTVQTFTLKSMLHIGRVLNPITLSQTETAPTTGKGHQDAKQAGGFITFYNGQLTSIIVSAGTTLTGTDGVPVVTDQDASIPAADLTANPPIIGNATVSAHALTPGVSGNIQALDINTQCCSSVVAKNLSRFSGGQDERNYQTVAKKDITDTATPLKTTLAQSMKGALQGQLRAGEELIPLPCTPALASDHQTGAEAAQVTVTVSATCSAAAYTSEELHGQAKQLVTSQARRKLGAGYTLLGAIQVTTTSVAANREQKRVVFSFHAQGTFMHTFTTIEQEHIKGLIQGKTRQQAVQMLATVPGIASASLQWHGFTDESRLPTDPRNIHVVVVYGIYQYQRFS